MPDTTTSTAPAIALIPAPRTPVPAPTPVRMPVYPLARRVQAAVDADEHPATRKPIHPDPAATCGTCIHAATRQVADGGRRTRCGLAVSRRGGPDILPIFPACTSHTPRTEGQP